MTTSRLKALKEHWKKVLPAGHAASLVASFLGAWKPHTEARETTAETVSSILNEQGVILVR